MPGVWTPSRSGVTCRPGAARNKPLEMTHSFPLRPSSMTRRLSTVAPVLTLRRSTTFFSLTISTYEPSWSLATATSGTRRAVFFCTGTRTWTYNPGKIFPSGFGEDSPQQQGSSSGGKADRSKIQAALMGIIFFIRQAHIYRPWFGTSLPRYPAGFSHQSSQIRVADVEINIDGINLVDRCQDGVSTRAHEVPRVFQPSINPAIKRSRDLRIAQIEFGQVSGRFCRLQVGLGRIPLISPVVYVCPERWPSAATDWSSGSIVFRHNPVGLFAVESAASACRSVSW